jgi:ABC-type transport system involved in cytochrome c biogenesis permease component
LKEGHRQVSSFKQIYIFLKKDLTIEVRRGYELVSLVAFSLVAALALGYFYQNTSQPTLPFDFLWLMLLFTVVLTNTTYIKREAERRTISGLKALPCSPITIYASKFIYTWFLNVILGFSTLGFIGIFVGLRVSSLPEFCLLLLLVLASLSAVSSFVSALTMQSEGKTLLLPLLLFLFSLPSITAAIIASEELILGINFVREIMLISAYMVMTLVLSMFLISYLMED